MLRGIDGELAERIKTIARDRKWALNDVILHLLRQALGLTEEDISSRGMRGDIATLGGTWAADEAAAFREALTKGKSVLLEPIMKVEVVTPEDYTGSVIGDLNSRRGQIQGQDMRGNANVINAMVPLMNMFGYVNNLRSMSQGRATFTMQFDHYAEAPANVSAEVQKKFA